jgi:Aminoglycoside-2''-adenylyltransferase
MLSAEVIAVMQAADIPAWLFGGWGLDARIGRITREHGDVEFWVERIHAGRSKAVLLGAGATALATQPPEEACEFTLDDVLFSTAYFDRRPDGSFSQPLGRWSDWLFPPGSFGDEPGMLDGLRRSGFRAARYGQSARGQTPLRTDMATLDKAPGWGRITAISVAAKSSPTHSTGCPVRSASAYVKQSPKFSPAG